MLSLRPNSLLLVRRTRILATLVVAALAIPVYNGVSGAWAMMPSLSEAAGGVIINGRTGLEKSLGEAIKEGVNIFLRELRRNWFTVPAPWWEFFPYLLLWSIWVGILLQLAHKKGWTKTREQEEHPAVIVAIAMILARMILLVGEWEGPAYPWLLFIELLAIPYFVSQNWSWVKYAQAHGVKGTWQKLLEEDLPTGPLPPVQQAHCRYCGNGLRPAAVCCNQCGTRVGQVEPPVVPPTAPAAASGTAPPAATGGSDWDPEDPRNL